MISSKPNNAHKVTTTYHKFQFGDNLIDYSVVRSKRLKTSEVIVDESSVVIRVPDKKPDSEIDNILRKKGDWIIEKKRNYHKSKKQIKKPSFEIGSTIPYLGKNYRIAMDSRNSSEHLVFRRGQFFVSPSNLTQQDIFHLYTNWLIQKSERIFHDKVAEYSDKLEVKPSRITIKNLRNRWGSVTKNGVLNLNLHLLKAPSEVINYIVIHELCHFKIKKHSHHFWELVKMAMPNYENQVSWLGRNASLLVE